MREFFPTKDVALNAKVGGGTIASPKEVDLLDNGAIAFITDTNKVLTTANVAAELAAGVKGIQVALGDGLGNTILSQRFRVRPLTIDKLAYVAPTKQVDYVGEDAGGTGALNFPATVVPGTEYAIMVIDKTAGVRKYNQERRFSYTAKLGDTTAIILAGIVANVNAGSSLVTASVVTGNVGIKLEAKDFGTHFETVVLDGGTIYSTIESAYKGTIGSAVAMNPGSGVASTLVELEKEWKGQWGYTNNTFLPQFWSDFKSKVDTALNYCMISILWHSQIDTASVQINAPRQKILIGVKDGSALATAVTTITDAILGVHNFNQ